MFEYKVLTERDSRFTGSFDRLTASGHRLVAIVRERPTPAALPRTRRFVDR